MRPDFIPLPFDIDEIFEIDEKRFVVLDYRRASNWTDWGAWMLIQDESGKQFSVPLLHVLTQRQMGKAQYRGKR